MTERPGTILVAGATGNQGGAVLRHLLNQGWKVRGDFDDRTSLDRALEGIYGVFMPSFQVNLRVTPEIEIKYELALIEAAKNAGVRNFVYTSETGANKNTGLGYLESKGQIESYIREICFQRSQTVHRAGN